MYLIKPGLCPKYLLQNLHILRLKYSWQFQKYPMLFFFCIFVVIVYFLLLPLGCPKRVIENRSSRSPPPLRPCLATKGNSLAILSQSRRSSSSLLTGTESKLLKNAAVTTRTMAYKLLDRDSRGENAQFLYHISQGFFLLSTKSEYVELVQYM